MGFEKAKRGNLAQSLVNLLYKLSLREFTKRAMTAHPCHFERSALVPSEKSKEFKIHLKALNSHLEFMDTSLRSV